MHAEDEREAVIQGAFLYTAVVQEPLNGAYKRVASVIRGEEAETRLEALEHLYPNKPFFVLGARDEAGLDQQVALLEAEGPLAAGLAIWSPAWELQREALEIGPGGDRDQPFRFYTIPFPHNEQVLMKWAANVQRGEVGGPDDGSDNGDED